MSFFTYLLIIILAIWILGYLFFKYLLPYLLKRFIKNQFGIHEEKNRKNEQNAETNVKKQNKNSKNGTQNNDNEVIIDTAGLEYTDYEEIK